MGEANQLGELQYAIMRVLWAEEEATVAAALHSGERAAREVIASFRA